MDVNILHEIVQLLGPKAAASFLLSIHVLFLFSSGSHISPAAAFFLSIICAKCAKSSSGWGYSSILPPNLHLNVQNDRGFVSNKRERKLNFILGRI